jgi:negative regulator of sigma E activity
MRIHKYLIFDKDFRVTLSLLCGPVLAFLLCAPQTLFADASTLEHIVKAEREVSYVGVRLKTFISSRGTRTFEELIIHKTPDAFYRKELSVVGERKSFGGTRGEDERRDENRRDNRRVDRDENRRNGRDSAREQSKWRQFRSLFSKKEIELIAQNYNMEKSSSAEKIANYETDILTITPKFDGRPTKRIFFARENAVVLRIEVLNAEGVLREMSVYTRISFDPETVERKWEVFQKEIKPEPEPSYSISLAEAEKTLKTKPIQPEYLPPGFQLQDVHSIKEKKNTIHLIYTDGLLGFSIFETTDKRARRSSRQRRESDVIELNGTSVHKHQRGPTYAFSWSSADIHFFLFGAMPPTEMQKVVESIIHKAKEK